MDLKATTSQNKDKSTTLDRSHNADKVRQEHHRFGWKAINVDAKHVIYRCDGICRENSKYNVQKVVDPRNPLTKFRSLDFIDYPVPSFTLDNNSVGVQPRREVSIFGLNDNINKAFLTDLCSKTGVVMEVFIYIHPRTKKHLGMAYIVFEKVEKALLFVSKNNGSSVMGQTITCSLDPYAGKISRRYEEIVFETAPLPRYLSLLNRSKLSELRKNNGCQVDAELSPRRNTFSDAKITVGLSSEDASVPNLSEQDEEGHLKLPEKVPASAIQRSSSALETHRSGWLSEVKSLSCEPSCSTAATHSSPCLLPPVTAQSSSPFNTYRSPSQAHKVTSCQTWSSTSELPSFNRTLALPPFACEVNGLSSLKQHSDTGLSNLPGCVDGNKLRTSHTHPSLSVNPNICLVCDGSVTSGAEEAPADPSSSKGNSGTKCSSTRNFSDRKRKKKRRSKYVYGSSESSASLSSSDDASAVENLPHKTKKLRSCDSGGSLKRIIPQSALQMRKDAIISPASTIAADLNSPCAEERQQCSTKNQKCIEDESMNQTCDSLSSFGSHLQQSREKSAKTNAAFEGWHRWSSTSSDESSSERWKCRKRAVKHSSSKPARQMQKRAEDLSRLVTSGGEKKVVSLLEVANNGNALSEKCGLQLVNNRVLPPGEVKFSLDKRLETFFKETSVQPLVKGPALENEKRPWSVLSSHCAIASVSEGPQVLTKASSNESQKAENTLYGVENGTGQRSQDIWSTSQYCSPTGVQCESPALSSHSQGSSHVRCVPLLYNIISEELKDILIKDLTKKVEQDAFEMLEECWNMHIKNELTESTIAESENLKKGRKVALGDKQILQNLPSSKNSLNEAVRQAKEQSMAEISAAFGPDFLTTGLIQGLDCIRSMPSFKKKKLAISPARRKKQSINRSSRSSSYSSSCDSRCCHDENKRDNQRSDAESSTLSEAESDASSSTRKGMPNEEEIASSDASSMDEISNEESLQNANSLEPQKDTETVEQGPMEHEAVSRDVKSENAEKLGEISHIVDKADEEGTWTEVCETRHSLWKTSSPKRQVSLNIRKNGLLTSDEETVDSCCGEVKAVEKTKPSCSPLHDTLKGGKASKEKRRPYKNELASILPPAVDVLRYNDVNWQPLKKWPRRFADEEREILRSFEKTGFDEEDLMYLEKAFHEMQNDGTATWGRNLFWVPPRKQPVVRLLDRPLKVGKLENYYDDVELAGIVPHSTGCARTEGYYKLSRKQKKGVLRRPDVFLTEINDNGDNKARHLNSSTREARNMNRRLLSCIGETQSDILKVNQLKYRKKLIKFARSRIHGWGLYALEPIAPDEMVVEYIGQKIRPTVADERERRYERRGMGSSYLFRIDSDSVIDATQMGNFARFINHSCQPNCYARIVVVDGEKRIVIYSKLPINKGDEITYDYKFPIEENKIDCLCGSPGCRGSLN